MLPLTCLSDITFQQYGAQPKIDGVTFAPLVKHRQLEGSFMEYVRLDHFGISRAPAVLFRPRQISVAVAEPNRINAFHIHPFLAPFQDEIWTVIHGEMLVWLVDARQSSPTQRAKSRFVLTGESPGMLLIPAGVAHGYKSGSRGATLIYAMTSQFDPVHPNEGRLPWDYFGAELWESDRG